MYSQKIIIICLILMLLFPLVFAADLTVSVDVPAKVAYGVPFPIVVKAVTPSAGNTKGTLIAYDFVVSSDKGIVTLSQPSGIEAGGVFKSEPKKTASIDNGKSYEVFTNFDTSYGAAQKKGFDASQAPGQLFVLTGVINGADPLPQGPVKITVKSISTLSYGAEVFTVSPISSADIPVALSDCNDGIVGYLNKKYAGGDTDKEKCDTKLSEGCSADCSYIKSTHRIDGQKNLNDLRNCKFGATSCSLKPLEGRDLLLAKVNAIFGDLSKVKSCFPYEGHPEQVSGEGGFCITTEGVATQIPELFKALRQFYKIS